MFEKKSKGKEKRAHIVKILNYSYASGQNIKVQDRQRPICLHLFSA